MFSSRRLMLIAGVTCAIAGMSHAGASTVSCMRPEVIDGARAGQMYGPYNSYEAANAKAEELRAQGHFARVHFEPVRRLWYVHADE